MSSMRLPRLRSPAAAASAEAAIEQALATFRGVLRRLEVKGESSGVLVVDDFAHHPTAIRVTIEAARNRSARPASLGRIRTAFEHHAEESFRTGPRIIPLHSRRGCPGRGESCQPSRRCGTIVPLARSRRHSLDWPEGCGIRILGRDCEYLRKKHIPATSSWSCPTAVLTASAESLLGRLQERGAPAGKTRG